MEEEKDSDIELYESSEESSDDERTWAKDMKKQHKLIRNKKQEEERDEERNEKVYEFSNAPKLTNIRSITRVSKSSLGDRLSKEGFTTMVTGTGGNKEMKFSMRGKKNVSDNQKSMKKHYEERKQLVRRTGFLSKKKLPRK